MFFKLSTLVVATLAVLATAASVPEKTQENQGNGVPHGINLNDGKTQTQICTTNLKCCKAKRLVTDTDVAKFGSDVSNINVGRDPIWVDCAPLESVDATCTELRVCCDKPAPDGSIAVDCKPIQKDN